MCDIKRKPSMNVVALTDLHALLNHFSKITYRPQNGDPFANEVMEKSVELFRTDYNVLLINNSNGDFSSHYPSQLPILEYERNQNNPPGHTSQRTTNTIYENIFDDHKFRDLISKARTARCRARFPVPVILFKGKYICRSATLSGGPEIYGRSGYDYLFNASDSCDNEDLFEPEPVRPVTQSDWQLFGRVRSSDIKLLKALNVGTIVDFMLEKKKVKFGMNVTSSEKVDKENRYQEFTLISLPYPGCEFFKDYRDHNYEAERLVFDWSQPFVDAAICVPNEQISNQLNIDWASYQSWDLETITKNYLKLLLKYLQDSNSGLLIHCISGWDRTPLFVSLIRLSLWADGLIHQNLDAQQILYLTIAYDWMLFGHHLPDRLGKGEEIFFFCFDILKKLTGEEFSVQGPPRFKSKIDKSVNRTDSDTLLDSLMFENDIRGSNISLNSTCSSVSTKSQEFPPMFWHGTTQNEDIHHLGYNHNGNQVNINEPSTSLARSPQSRRTSPVTVPSRLRQRQESTSSLSMGSWHLITGAGSVRDSETSDTSNGLNANSECCSTSHDSSHTLIDEDTVMTYNIDEYAYRKRRLLKVREIFLSCYHSTIGFKFKNGDSSLGTFLGNIAEKVSANIKSYV